MMKCISCLALLLLVFTGLSGCGGDREKDINKDKDKPKPAVK